MAMVRRVSMSVSQTGLICFQLNLRPMSCLPAVSALRSQQPARYSARNEPRTHNLSYGLRSRFAAFSFEILRETSVRKYIGYGNGIL